ncbi:hypothetical protein FRC06_001289, partial [Ceratobasidium sp. 370]
MTTAPYQSPNASVTPTVAMGWKHAHSVSELTWTDNAPALMPPPKSPKQRRNRHKKLSGPAFDATPSEVDPRWADLPEIEAIRGKLKSGPHADQLARQITRPCHPSGEHPRHNNHYFRCIASSVCGWRQKNWDRQLPRIYRHAADCKALHRWKPDLSAAAKVALANMAPGGLQSRLMDEAQPQPTKGNEDQLIPAEAQHAVFYMCDFMRGQRNLSLLFNGLTAGEQPIYTVHVCTPKHVTFLYRADVFYGSHDSRYIEDLLEQVITEIGVDQIASIVSDDTNVTKKAQHEITHCIPSILNLADPIHKLNLFSDTPGVQALQQAQKLLAHFKMSTQATAKLNAVRKILRILRGLQSIRNTRFATIYYAVTSILDNLPALYKIYREHEIDTVGTPLPDIIAEVIDERNVVAMHFKTTLTKLANILEPFARALLCLESTHSTLADVYVFWLSVLAALHQHFSSGHSLLTPDDKSCIIAIASKRFNEAINDAPADGYITAFFLDPHKCRYLVYHFFVLMVCSGYHNAAIYAGLGHPEEQPLHPMPYSQGPPATSLSHSAQRQPSRLTEALFMRVRRQLLLMLRSKLQVAESNPDHPLHTHSYNALEAKEQLCQQLDVYYRADKLPFSHAAGVNKAAIGYWRSQQEFSQTFLLAYLTEKIFSVLPNSMCDEHSGSQITHLYSKLRTQLEAKSMIKQIQFMQWNSLTHPMSPSPQTQLPEMQVVCDSVEITTALPDEIRDSWLSQLTPQASVIEDVQRPGSTMLVESDIDLTSKLLINVLAAGPSSDTPESVLMEDVKGLK